MYILMSNLLSESIFDFSVLTGVGSHFLPKIFLKTPNFLKFAQVLVVACRKDDSNSARWFVKKIEFSDHFPQVASLFTRPCP